MNTVARILIGLAVVAFVAGCSDEQTSKLNQATSFNQAHPSTPQQAQQTMNDAIAKIQNDPTYTPEMKAMAIGQLQAHSGHP